MKISFELVPVGVEVKPGLGGLRTPIGHSSPVTGSQGEDLLVCVVNVIPL